MEITLKSSGTQAEKFSIRSVKKRTYSPVFRKFTRISKRLLKQFEIPDVNIDTFNYICSFINGDVLVLTANDIGW